MKLSLHHKQANASIKLSKPVRGNHEIRGLAAN